MEKLSEAEVIRRFNRANLIRKSGSPEIPMDRIADMIIGVDVIKWEKAIDKMLPKNQRELSLEEKAKIIYGDRINATFDELNELVSGEF